MLTPATAGFAVRVIVMMVVMLVCVSLFVVMAAAAIVFIVGHCFSAFPNALI